MRRVWLGRTRQEEDVLDTWFSSALYPFATLGWPDETPELERYYPGTVLTTARDIIFLWVARMVFSGLELLGEEPFDDVLIHSTLLNPRRTADVADARNGNRPEERSSRTERTRRDMGCSRSPRPRTRASPSTRSRRVAGSRSSSGTSRG